MSKDNPVVSSHTWSQWLKMDLPDPLPWGLFDLITETEFRARMENVGTPNIEKKEETHGSTKYNSKPTRRKADGAKQRSTKRPSARKES